MPLAIAAHRVLADAEAEVAAGGRRRSKSPSPLTSVRLDSERSAAPPNSSGTRRAERLDRVLARVPRRDLGARPYVRQVRVPAVGRGAREPRAGTRPPRPGTAPRTPSKRALPRRRPVPRRPGPPARKCARSVVRHVERPVRIPAVGLLGEPDLVRAERRAVRLLGVLLVRAAVADVRADGDEARPVVGAGAPRSPRSIASTSLPSSTRWRVPAVGLEARERRPRDQAIEVGPSSWMWLSSYSDDQLAQPQVAGQRRGLGRDALLQVAVGGDRVGPVVDDRRGPGRLNSAARRRSAMAMPTAFVKPWPSGPVVASTPGVRPYSGWPGRDRAPLPERLRSSSETS